MSLFINHKTKKEQQSVNWNSSNYKVINISRLIKGMPTIINYQKEEQKQRQKKPVHRHTSNITKPTEQLQDAKWVFFNPFKESNSVGLIGE